MHRSAPSRGLTRARTRTHVRTPKAHVHARTIFSLSFSPLFLELILFHYCPTQRNAGDTDHSALQARLQSSRRSKNGRRYDSARKSRTTTRIIGKEPMPKYRERGKGNMNGSFLRAREAKEATARRVFASPYKIVDREAKSAAPRRGNGSAEGHSVPHSPPRLMRVYARARARLFRDARSA